jgi:hypothetical protein
MSHFTTIQTQIRDEAALRAACREMGFIVESNAEARGYSSNRIKGDLVIRLKGPYDIAVGFSGPDCEKATAFLEKALGALNGGAVTTTNG